MGLCVLVFIHVHVILCVCLAHECMFLCMHVGVYSLCLHGRNCSEPSTCTHVHACTHTHIMEAGKSPSRHKPVFEAPDDLLEEDDSVGDGLVPLHLQQHVMVVLEGRAS